MREVFGLGAWGGAVFVAKKDYQWPKDFFAQWIRDPAILNGAGFFSVFCIALIVFLCIAQWLSMVIERSFAQTVDRSLGLVFGFFRGLCVICGTYMGSIILFSADKIPIIVSTSKSAAWLNHAVILCTPLVERSLSNNPKFIKNLRDVQPPKTSPQHLTHALSSPPLEPGA